MIDSILRREDVMALMRKQLQAYDTVYHQYRRAYDFDGMARIDHKLQALEKMMEAIAEMPVEEVSR